MQLTTEQLEKVSHIPTGEVESDLLDAQHELLGYVTEKEAIESAGANPSNRVRHYMLSAKCDKGNEFIDELNQILAYRSDRAKGPP